MRCSRGAGTGVSGKGVLFATLAISPMCRMDLGHGSSSGEQQRARHTYPHMGGRIEYWNPDELKKWLVAQPANSEFSEKIVKNKSHWFESICPEQQESWFDFLNEEGSSSFWRNASRDVDKDSAVFLYSVYMMLGFRKNLAAGYILYKLKEEYPGTEFNLGLTDFEERPSELLTTDNVISAIAQFLPDDLSVLVNNTQSTDHRGSTMTRQQIARSIFTDLFQHDQTFTSLPV